MESEGLRKLRGNERNRIGNKAIYAMIAGVSFSIGYLMNRERTMNAKQAEWRQLSTIDMMGFRDNDGKLERYDGEEWREHSMPTSFLLSNHHLYFEEDLGRVKYKSIRLRD